MGAGVLVEGNYFESVDEPTLVGYADSADGAIVQRNNYFTGSGSPESGGGSVSSIPYSYTLDSAGSVKASVSAGAGAGRITV
jgi:pectate lyase